MSSAIFNKFMNMLGISSKDDDEEENVEEYDNEDIDNEEEVAQAVNARSAYRPRRSFRDVESDNQYSSRNMQSKIIPMNSSMSSSKMVITQPKCYEDVQEIGGYLKERRAVIINLESVNREVANKILDFLSGATFIVDGTVQKVSNCIYLMTPKNIEIQNDSEKDAYKQKVSFSWLK